MPCCVRNQNGDTKINIMATRPMTIGVRETDSKDFAYFCSSRDRGYVDFINANICKS